VTRLVQYTLNEVGALFRAAHMSDTGQTNLRHGYGNGSQIRQFRPALRAQRASSLRHLRTPHEAISKNVR
jgi:hypothetical protein